MIDSGLIHIRTRYHMKDTGNTSQVLTRGSGTDIRGIRPFDSGDDARDIAWNRSIKIPETLYTKERESESQISVIFWSVWKVWFDFFTPNHPKTKAKFFEEMQQNLKKSSQVFHFPLLSYTEDISPESLLKNKVSNKLILLISSSLDTREWKNIHKLSEHNDIILVHVFHPFEVDPGWEQLTLIENKVLSLETYKQKFLEKKKSTQAFLKKKWVSIIEANSNENASLILNQFFKYRYVR